MLKPDKCIWNLSPSFHYQSHSMHLSLLSPTKYPETNFNISSLFSISNSISSSICNYNRYSFYLIIHIPYKLIYIYIYRQLLKYKTVRLQTTQLWRWYLIVLLLKRRDTIKELIAQYTKTSDVHTCIMLFHYRASSRTLLVFSMECFQPHCNFLSEPLDWRGCDLMYGFWSPIYEGWSPFPTGLDTKVNCC